MYNLNPNKINNIFEYFQNLVVGYFDFKTTSHPDGYMQYYYASLRVLEKGITIMIHKEQLIVYIIESYIDCSDPKNVIDFVVITNAVFAHKVALSTSKSFVLYRRDNATLVRIDHSGYI